MDACIVISRAHMRDFIKTYAADAPLRFSTEQLNLYCMEAEE